MCMTLQNQGKNKRLNSWSHGWIFSTGSTHFNPWTSLQRCKPIAWITCRPQISLMGLRRQPHPSPPPSKIDAAASSSTTYGNEAKILLGSDSDDSDEGLVGDSDAD